ncbi:hypothetical protein C8E83_1301 [Frondihabitans australicus]|uniref:Uncharacterized protein n=1 Tax=Frondihabitans australicus TaxID=386892 RepID=A0A495IDW2_9MICO|nr:hypothetical protein C8E83_1301 [Frondihabitans australicus]
MILLCCLLWARSGDGAALADRRARVVERTELLPVTER